MAIEVRVKNKLFCKSLLFFPSSNY